MNARKFKIRSNTFDSEPAVIEFAEVSRVDDGHVLGAPAAKRRSAVTPALRLLLFASTTADKHGPLLFKTLAHRE